MKFRSLRHFSFVLFIQCSLLNCNSIAQPTKAGVGINLLNSVSHLEPSLIGLKIFYESQVYDDFFLFRNLDLVIHESGGGTQIFLPLELYVNWQFSKYETEPHLGMGIGYYASSNSGSDHGIPNASNPWTVDEPFNTGFGFNFNVGLTVQDWYFELKYIVLPATVKQHFSYTYPPWGHSANIRDNLNTLRFSVSYIIFD